MPRLSDDDYWERHDARIEWLRDEPPARSYRGCQCGPDLPGRCPGPDNCPLCEEDHDETDD